MFARRLADLVGDISGEPDTNDGGSPRRETEHLASALSETSSDAPTPLRAWADHQAPTAVTPTRPSVSTAYTPHRHPRLHRARTLSSGCEQQHASAVARMLACAKKAGIMAHDVMHTLADRIVQVCAC